MFKYISYAEPPATPVFRPIGTGMFKGNVNIPEK
jgi:hypothetical protein